MIVLDTSALLEFLLQTSLGRRVEARILRDAGELHAPHLVDVEMTQGLRRLVRAGDVSPGRAARSRISVISTSDRDLLTRAWARRANLTAYDAMYVALAEALDAPLVTCDVPLARTPGHRASIEPIE